VIICKPLERGEFQDAKQHDIKVESCNAILHCRQIQGLVKHIFNGSHKAEAVDGGLDSIVGCETNLAENNDLASAVECMCNYGSSCDDPSS
jgi:hypothetical protein